MIVSPINVPVCQRCGKPIVKGARCELFGAHNAVVHLGCKLKVTQLPNPAQSGAVPAAKPADGSWEALVAGALDANLTIDDLVKPVDTGSDSYAADVVTYTDDNEVTSGFPDAPSGSHQTPTEYGDGSEDGDPSESGSPAMTLTIMTLSADLPAPAPEDIPDPSDFGMEGDSAQGEGDAQGDDGEQSETETDTDSQTDSQSSDSNEDEEMAAPKPNSEEFNEAVEAAAAAGMERATNIFNARVQQMAAAAIKTALPALQKNLESQIGSATTSAMQQVAQQTQKETQRMMDAAMKEVMRAIGALVKENKPQVITIQQPDRELVTLDGEVFHEQFEEVLELLSLGFNTFCPGPTGAGKTHLAEQVARALGLEFGMLSGSAGTTESEFFGTSYPNITTGENCYVESDFVRIYENGGLFLIDEADALDPNCFLKVNAALSNGFCTVPKRYGNTRAVKHANFRCMIAANTWGTGASRQYCGRNKLDEATIDRFRAGSVAINYSKRIETSLCPDPALLGTLHRWRAEIMRANMQRVLSTRFIMHAYRLQQAGKDLKYIAEKLTGGWTPKEIAEVIGDTLTAKPGSRPAKPGTKPIRY